MVNGGIEKSEADAKVETFAGLTDDQFAILANELIRAAKVQSAPPTDKADAEKAAAEKAAAAKTKTPADDDTDGADANADDKVLANAKPDKEVAGIVAGTDFLSFDPLWEYGIGVGFMFYFASYMIARIYISRYLLPTEYRKMVTTGLPGYIFMFLIVWILYNTYKVG